MECLSVGIGLNISHKYVGHKQEFLSDINSVTTWRLHHDDRNFYEYSKFTLSGHHVMLSVLP